VKLIPVAVLVSVALAACSGDAAHDVHADVTVPPAAVATVKDTFLDAALKTKLSATDVDWATRIHVAAHAGAVKLSGVVGSAAEKDRAIAAARSVSGVASVDAAGLRVGHVGPGLKEQVGDAGLATAVAAAITAQAGVNVARLKIAAHGGTVTLGGSASSEAIKSTAVSAARGTAGVRNVVDRIVVK
jgi:hyperosmotically inducible protein